MTPNTEAPEQKTAVRGTYRTAEEIRQSAEEKIGRAMREVQLLKQFTENYATLLAEFLWEACTVYNRINITCRETFGTSDPIADPKKIAKSWPNSQWMRVKASFNDRERMDWEAEIDGVKVRILGAEMIPTTPAVNTLVNL